VSVEVSQPFSSRIRDALYDPAPRESVSRVKHAVADELGALDPTAKIVSTEYFNHTYVPDFVVSWEDRSERFVFLRTTYDMQAVGEDARLIQAEGPMIFGLTSPEKVPSELDAALESTSGFFTEPEAVESLIGARELPTARMVSNALLQGGRGALVGTEALSLGREVASGLHGARELSVEPTARALAAVDEFFDPVRASRLTRVVQAVWEGSEGRLDLFPGKVDLSGRLSESELQYLIDFLDTDDDVFWKRIGRSLTLGQLEKLRVGDRHLAFNSLVRANLDMILAGATALFPDELGVDALMHESSFGWSIREQRVSFSGPRFHALLGEMKEEVATIARGSGRGAAPETVVDRAPELELSQVRVRARGESIAYSSEEGTLDRQRLLGIAQQLAPDVPLAVSAVAHAPSGNVNVDFTKDLAWRTTNSKLLMADLLATAIPLLHDFTAEERAGFRSALAYEEDSPILGFDVLDAADAGD